MKGLLLKDAYQMWCYTRWIILVSIAMMLMGMFFMKDGSNFFMLYGGLLLGMSPISLLAYDQGSRFSVCSAALPVTKEQLVGGKYLIGLCGMALAELLSMAALAAAQLLWGTVSVQITVATLIQVAMLTLLDNIILLPLFYRFGYEKAKYVYYLSIGMLGSFMGYSVSSGDSALDSILPAQGLLLVLVVVLAVVLTLLVIWRSNDGVLSAHYNVTTTEGRITYLRALGWEADPATETAQEIVLPRTFDGVFGDYNALQKQQGFDLSIYAGETCSVYTYRVMNYAGTSDTVLAQLFVYRNRVIGGDIHATAMDGFMHGLR